ncbi:hypothetical protein CP973_07010 [Streptomyces albofaciens JCM 4342]|nr:hypothetical protein CP973_07010 [Streptomyces albofaciens JCM 4342]
MHLRQVTACSEPSTYTTRRPRKGAPTWQIYTCRRHRTYWHYPDGLRRLPLDGEHPACGTVHDYRPHAEIIVSHLTGWMCLGGIPVGVPRPAADDWQARLRIAARGGVADAALQAVLDRAVHHAEAGETHAVLALLAAAETEAAGVRGRAR